jgi:hypothetical protein
MQMADWGLEVSRLIIDGDQKFRAGFDAVFESQATYVQRGGRGRPT